MTDILKAVLEYMSFSHFMVFIYILNTLISLGLIFVDKTKSASAIMAWIMVLYILPVVGLVMYLILSQNIARKKIFRMTADEEAGIGTLLEWQKEAVRKGISVNPEDETYKWRNMILLNLEYADSLLIDCKEVELIYDGQEMFDRLLEDIRNAKYTIKLCYYIIRDDDTGKELIELLTKEAGYEYILLDLKEYPDGFFEILDMCDVIYTVIRNNSADHYRLGRYNKALGENDYERIITKTMTGYCSEYFCFMLSINKLICTSSGNTHDILTCVLASLNSEQERPISHTFLQHFNINDIINSAIHLLCYNLQCIRLQLA